MSTWTDKMHARAREATEIYYPDSLHKAFLFHALDEIERLRAENTNLLAEVERLRDELAKTRAVTEDKVEVACKAFYEAGADKLDDTIRPLWDNLVRVNPGIAQGYRERVSAALAAPLGSEH